MRDIQEDGQYQPHPVPPGQPNAGRPQQYIHQRRERQEDDTEYRPEPAAAEGSREVGGPCNPEDDVGSTWKEPSEDREQTAHRILLSQLIGLGYVRLACVAPLITLDVAA